MRATDIMTRPVACVYRETAVREATVLLVEDGFAAVPVVDEDDQLVGIITEADVLRNRARITVGQDGTLPMTVGEVMTTPVTAMPPNVDAAILAERMLQLHLRCIPIVEAGILIGMVSRRDLLRTLVHDDDFIATKVRRDLDAYAGLHQLWIVEVHDGVVTISGEFADEAEQRIMAALCRTVPGVVRVIVRHVMTSRDERAGQFGGCRAVADVSAGSGR